MSKKLILLFLIINSPLSIINCSAQGTILGFYTDPASPTTNDAVKVIASLSFTSGGCDVTQQGHTTNGVRTDANAHHCLGMLTFICSTTDTFELGSLPAGNHTFVLTLTSGGGPAPCTPGIVIDDTDSITFTVDPGVGINSPDTKPVDFSIYPNPASSTLNLNTELIMDNGELTITNTLGQKVLQLSIIHYPLSIDVSQLSTGLYYLHLQTAEGVGVKKFEVIR